MKTTDRELLRRYAQERSETAFEELVRSRIKLVYSAALRQVNNDKHMAEDVTQAVFSDLARKAPMLAHHPSITGWLYTSTRFIAANMRRTRQRRIAHEEEAHAMNAIYPTQESEPDWADIGPLLDEAMHTLDDQDREAVLLRHFEQCSYAEIGARFGLTEDAVRMRINRALERLRDALAKGGVTSTALVLARLLADNAVGEIPAHLAGKTANVAMLGAAGGKGLAILLGSKFKITLAAAVLALGVALVVISRRSVAESSGTLAANATTNSAAARATEFAPPVVSPAAGLSANVSVLHLQIVTADSGKPIPMVSIDYHDWRNQIDYRGIVLETDHQKTLWSDRYGVCEVIYPADISQLDLTTGREPFADTLLRWRRTLGDVIPTNYVLRVERAVPIAGKVVDSEGNPVGGATVTWGVNEPYPEAAKPPRDHEYYGNHFEAVTDQLGRWQVNRMARDIIPYLVGEAKESNHVDAKSIFIAQDRTVEERLRENTYVFKMGVTVGARGVVMDPKGAPILHAKISVSGRNAQSRSNGAFSVGGCRPGKQLITVEAPGFAVTTTEVDLGENSKPIRLVLCPGKLLDLRIEDNVGKPITQAQVIPFRSKTDREGRVFWTDEPNLEIKFTDQKGRVSWTNAPDAEMEFQVSAPGWGWTNSGKIQPDGQEHIVKLSPDSR